MKILVPLSAPEETSKLLDAGADELYFGICTDNKPDDTNCLNFRPNAYSNLRSIAEAQAVIDIVKKKRKSTFLCLNARIFESKRHIFRLLDKLDGLTGVIVADPALIDQIRKNFSSLKLVGSIRVGALNSSAINFFRDLGIKRFTAPLRLSFDEVRKLIRSNDCEFEIFVKNEGCINLSGYCNYTHNIWGDLCDDKKGVLPTCKKKEGLFILKNGEKSEIGGNLYKNYHENFKNGTCGICFLSFFTKEEQRRLILKIDGRLLGLNRKLEDLNFIRQSAKCVEKLFNSAKGPIGEIEEIYADIYKRPCNKHCSYKS